MTQEQLARLHDEARAEMKKIPGVVGVGYGFKRTAGKLTDQVGFTVYVKEKKDKSQLKPDEIIPSEYKGIATDVAIVPQVTDCDCQDHTTHSPLIGGITVSTLIPDSQGNYPFGTLGFFATINGTQGPDNVVLVSNAHVLTAGGAAAGATIYQPPLVPVNGGWGLDTSEKADHHPIGDVVNAGLEGNWAYTYPGPGATQQNYYIDCATAKINICVSSWCKTNCGVSFTDQVINLAVNNSNAIVEYSAGTTI